MIALLSFKDQCWVERLRPALRLLLLLKQVIRDDCTLRRSNYTLAFTRTDDLLVGQVTAALQPQQSFKFSFCLYHAPAFTHAARNLSATYLLPSSIKRIK
jgi:hypothetical protein